MNLIEHIKNDKKLNELLLQECDIYFYKQMQATRFTENHEIYSIPCKAFAQDGSGGEFVFLDDDSIGFISSEGEVGRIAERLEDLLTFLIHAGNIFDFNCQYIYQKKELLKIYCDGYVLKIRMDYKSESKDWDMIRSDIARELSLPFKPDQLNDFAMSFYKAATRMPKFSCVYFNGEDEYTCNSVLSDVVSIWVTELTGMTIQEIEKEQ